MEQFDLVVIGGGPGGYVAALRGAQLGMKTALIEQDRLGGVCSNWGCIPTKALLKSAAVLHTVKEAKRYGIEVPEYRIHFGTVIKRSRQAAERLSKGVAFLLKKHGVRHIEGRATLRSRTVIDVTAGKQQLKVQAGKIILATGGRPRTIPGLEPDGDRVIGSREAMLLPQPPRRLVIIGGGAIGVEFAYFFNEFGTAVHLVEMLPRILPGEDEEISRELEKSFRKSGIQITTGAQVARIDRLKTKVKVTVNRGDETEVIEGEQALVAVGVVGNIEGIGLETVGVTTTDGLIAIDARCQTSIPGIYAVGDVTGPPYLAHRASAQGVVAAEHAAGRTVRPLDDANIPACVYCEPQVASVGLTEQAAREQGYDVKVGRFPFRANGKALAAGETTGFVKLVFDRRYGELLGGHIIGAEATEMIAELGTAKALETTWEELATTIHAHPTLSEAVMEAALDAFRGSIHQ
jgi:dihydrolipoamide dehydrogenase